MDLKASETVSAYKGWSGSLRVGCSACIVRNSSGPMTVGVAVDNTFLYRSRVFSFSH